MKKTLGIDLGSNSLGWAILDDVTSDILDKGVIVFPEGVDVDAGTSLETPAAERRAARMARRMKFRRKTRKWALLKVLIENDMCPMTKNELTAWKNLGRYPVANQEFIKWLASTDESNPYADRAAAASGKVDRYTLGRALYHICQRRGFKSSRKEEASLVDEEGNVKETKESGAVKEGIAELTREIEKSGCETLGQYFAMLIEREKSSVAKTRVRKRYTHRVEHYEKEFKVIMLKQGMPSNSTLFKQFYNAIFYQRPLRSQKHLVSKCPLERNLPRAQIGNPLFEEFRMRAFVNNLSLEDKDGIYRDDDGNLLYPLTNDDREKICGAFMRKSATMQFKAINALFKKDPRFKADGMRFHYYEDGDAVSACPTSHKIALAFGEIDHDVQKVFDALMFYNDTEMLEGWFRKHYPKLSDLQIKQLCSIHPKEGNAQYSLKAIKKILRFLRKGYELSYARFLAKLPDYLPDFDENEQMVIMRLDECRMNNRRARREYGELSESIRKVTEKPVDLYACYRDCLLEFGLKDEDWEKLYLRGEDHYEPETSYKCNGNTVKLAKPRIPAVELGMIRNPLVQRAMTTLRRLVNYLAEHGKLDQDDTIRIELARSVNDFATRKAWQAWQENRRQQREKAASEIMKLGKAVTEDAIDRYVLWEEQGEKCLYTGKNIKLADLFDGNKYDIEHTVPRCLCGDDSLANKTICEASYNRKVKKGQVPVNCPNYDEIAINLRAWKERLGDLEKLYRQQSFAAKKAVDPAAHGKARVKALTTRFELQYWRDKVKRFEVSVDKYSANDGEIGGFKRRQLVDTGIMSSHAVELLKSVYKQTYAVNGAATAFARKAWGLQSDEAKDRTEHTHHAKDAMVIAALTPSRFNAICTALKDDGISTAGRECDFCMPPCKDFATKVRLAADEILVRHVLRQTTMRQSMKRNALAKGHESKSEPGKFVKAVLSKGDTVRGPLHKDTFYGCIKDPESGSLKKVVRKSLVGKVKDISSIVDKIVDPKIKEIVAKAIEGKSGNDNIAEGEIKMPSGVPINKARVFMPTATNASQLKMHTMPSVMEYKNPYYVTSAEGSNFRLAVFDIDGRKSVVPENSLDWAQRHKKSDYVPADQKKGFVGYIYPGSMAIAIDDGGIEAVKSLSAKELTKRLYKVVKFESTGRVTFRRHVEARASVVLAKQLVAIGKHKAGESSIDLVNPHELLLLSPGNYLAGMLLEGVDFKMMIDGTIQFLR